MVGTIDRQDGDKVIRGKSGFILIRDQRVYSINMLVKINRFEIRYQLTREDYFEAHGISHLWALYAGHIYD